MIKIYNRKSNTYDIEDVAGEKFLNWTYSSPVGMGFLELIVKKKLFSKLVGSYCDSKLSKRKIDKFIKTHNIDTAILKKDKNAFACFNDFFIRELKPEYRPIALDKNILISPGDGRISVYENISADRIYEIKGYKYSLSNLINNKEVADKYNNGICIIIRLNPLDYHRFHFVDDGICDNNNYIKGDLYSVNPIAFNKIPDLFCRNKREWTIFHSDNFNDILHIEVGATCVGSIIQTYTPNEPVKRGQQKGYFKFGGSTTILIFKKGTITIDNDIITQTNLGYETKVNLGEKIGRTTH